MELTTRVLSKLIKINKVVISTGGGIILKNKNILDKCFNMSWKSKLRVNNLNNDYFFYLSILEEGYALLRLNKFHYYLF